MPPRGSPKIRKGTIQQQQQHQQQHYYHHHNKTTDENIMGASSFTTISGNTYSEASPSGRNRLQNIENNKLQLLNEPPVPKFGEQRSPSNVRDWLEVNNFKFIHDNDLNKEEIILTTSSPSSPPLQPSPSSLPPPPLPALSPQPQPQPVPSILSDLREKRKEFRNRQLPSKAEFFKRQNSFLSQSGRSSIGSIVHQFPPIASSQQQQQQQSIKSSMIRKRDKRNKKEYFDYIDMAIGDNDEEDNIINSLYAFVEAKKEIESKLLHRQIKKIDDNIISTQTNTTSDMIEQQQQQQQKIDRKLSVAPSIIFEGSSKATSATTTIRSDDTSTGISGVSEIRRRKKNILRKMSDLNYCDSDDSIIKAFDLKGEYV